MVTLQALPGHVAVDATCIVLFSGRPDRAVSWSLTGPGSLVDRAAYTGANGQATAKYIPDATPGTATVTVTYGA